MRVLYLGVYADTEKILEINKKSSNDSNVSVAAINYTRLIGDGLVNEINYDCTRLFLEPVGMFPYCKQILWLPKRQKGIFYIPFVNVIILKQISISLYLFFFSFYWYLKNYSDEKKVIISSFVYLPFLVGVIPLKIFKSIHLVSFVPDLPDYEYTYAKSKYNLKSLLVPIYIFLSNKVMSQLSYFIFITKYMAERFPNKPHSIIEGFTEYSIENYNNSMINKSNAIMYAGALYEKYGIVLLLKAFIEIKGDYELWLFGNGDISEVINQYLELDKRIKYFGVLPNNKIVEYEKKAKLLVNPRPSDNEFTKFSFPSKIMEYLASGTPVLTTKLPGIPEEYFDKMYFIDSETVEGFKKSILTCLSKSDKELNEFGNTAKSFVLSKKNNHVQIKNLIQRLSSVMY